MRNDICDDFMICGQNKRNLGGAARENTMSLFSLKCFGMLARKVVRDSSGVKDGKGLA
jgi:hypothetical protein